MSNIYTLPFRSNVWISCLILFAVSSTLLFLTSKAESHDIKADNDAQHADGSAKIQQIRFSDSVMSTIAAICQMDPSTQSNVTSSKIIMVSETRRDEMRVVRERRQMMSLNFVFFSSISTFLQICTRHKNLKNQHRKKNHFLSLCQLSSSSSS